MLREQQPRTRGWTSTDQIDPPRLLTLKNRTNAVWLMDNAVLVPVEVAVDLAGADPAGGVVDRMVVAEALAALPAAYREVIVLADLLDFPGGADGRTAGHRGAGRQERLHRARRALAGLLGQAELRRSA